MTQAPEVPQYMRRNILDPIPEWGQIRESTAVRKLVTALGMPAYLVTRHDDVKAALADPQRSDRLTGHGAGFWAGGLMSM